MASQIDIAKASGVTQSIVSRILSGHWEQDRIARRTAEKVLRIAREMDYRPNLAANIVFGRKTNLIGVVVRSFHDPYLSIILDEINERAVQDKLSVIVAGMSKGVTPLQAVHLLRGYRPDAVIVVGTIDFSEWKKQMGRSGQKIIQIGLKTPEKNIISCSSDEYSGAELLVDHLRSLGHKKIGFIRDRSLTSVVRENALQTALAKHRLKLKVVEFVALDTLSNSLPAGDPAVQKLSEKITAGELTALICVGDMIATAFATRLMQTGIQIPQEVSLASYNDVPMAAMFNPPLTTIHLPSRELAGAAMDIVTGQRAARSLNLKPSLIVRASTAAVAPE
ncbi:MAG: LacI family DNA-binding transcriptional regulator [Kiritimatiellales bacterium]